MQTQDIIRVLQSSDRLQIKKGKTLIYAGYVASMEHTDIEEEILSAEVKRFQAVPEIRHKEWQKRGLMKPLQPEEMMLSRLVDTFFSRTSWTMLLYAENHSISVA